MQNLWAVHVFSFLPMALELLFTYTGGAHQSPPGLWEERVLYRGMVSLLLWG